MRWLIVAGPVTRIHHHRTQNPSLKLNRNWGQCRFLPMHEVTVRTLEKCRNHCWLGRIMGGHKWMTEVMTEALSSLGTPQRQNPPLPLNLRLDSSLGYDQGGHALSGINGVIVITPPCPLRNAAPNTCGNLTWDWLRQTLRFWRDGGK